MPLVRISLRKGKPAAYRRAIRDNVYLAMREAFAVPENDRFIVVDQYDPDDLDIDPSYLGIQRSEDCVIIQITANNTRTTEQKQAFFKRLVERLGDDPGLRPEDVFINLVEVVKENWSFGLGVAQYA